ncbi:MAG TPA: FtsQ-type POTRA domain-containing protein [Micromonosporaceae bacterium]|nr:FtsQ-type POTRA domain-containing protein [Micromonosporaceae bacterium]
MNPRPARRWRLVRARPDAVPASVRRFNQRARQWRRQAAVPWAVGAAGLLAVGLLVWLVYGTAVLGVREVRVTGVEILSPDQVRIAAAVRAGTPLARVNLAAVRARVAELAPVGRVVVSRDWPRAVHIAVVERTPVAVVPRDGKFLLLDAGGVGFHTVAARPPDLPQVLVANPGPADPATRAVLRVLVALSPQLRTELVSLAAEAATRIRLDLRGKRTVIWGDATENERKAQVATVLLGHGGNRIDVSAPEVATVR